MQIQNYWSTLEQKMNDFPPKRKSDRTRASLKIATAKLLDRVGYRDMTITDITKTAGLGRASFHDYFENRTQITKEIMIEFVGLVEGTKPPPQSQSNIFTNMYYANKAVISIFQANSGLMRCLFQLGDQDKEFNDLCRKMNLTWYKNVANTISDRRRIKTSKPLTFLTIYSLGGMIDEFMRGLYVYNDTEVLEILKDHGIENNALAYYFAIIWYRAIFAKDPDDIPQEVDPKIIQLFADELGMGVF